MEVKRVDIYDFKIVFTHTELMKLNAIAKARNETLEIVIKWFIDYGIEYSVNN